MREISLNKIFRMFVFCLGIGIVGGCVTVPREKRAANEIPLQELSERYQIPLQWDTISQVVTLSDGQVKARILVGSDVVMLEEEKIQLSARVKRAQNIILVSPDFEEKVMKRFTAWPAIIKFRRIVLDPGHGGKDTGAISPSGFHEKNIVLEIAQKVKQNLIQQGIDVVMTREGDEFVSLEGRTEIASRAKADLFVSIHANANPYSRSLAGLEVYYLSELSSKDRKEEQRLKNHHILFQELAMDRASIDLQNIVADMLLGYKQQESHTFASQLAKNIAKNVGMHDRGDKMARFFVLRNTLIPAVLIEVGYLTNPEEERLLATTDYHQKIADGISMSLLEYGKTQ